MDKITEASLLYDFYGQLLSQRKRQVMELYHEEDLSLTEIAEEFGISRAAVYDSLKSAEKALQEYEEKLGLLARFMRTGTAIRRIDGMIEELIEEYRDNRKLAESLEAIRSVISGLEEG